MARYKRVGEGRAMLDRMQQIHLSLQDRKYPNSPKLAKDFDVTKRTIKRDIEFMKDRLNLPIAFDTQRNGYHYTKPVPKFPEFPMTEAEVFALLVASKAIEQYRGTPFQRPLETAFRRLTGQLDGDTRFSLGSLDDVLSFRPFAPGDADLQAFEILTRGVRDRRVVTFLYRKHGAMSFDGREVHPYHLGYVDGRWSLFAFDPARNDIRTFVLCRLKQPKVTAKRFKLAKKFDLNEYLQNSFGLYRGNGGNAYEVVVDLDAWAADGVRGRQWHSSQALTELPEGRLRVTFRLNSLGEVERWVMGFGAHATVVSPKCLAARLAATATEWQKKYAAAAPA